MSVPALRAGGMLSPIYPQSIEEVYRLATMAMQSGMLKPVTKGWGDEQEVEPQEATLARGTMIIMQGMEIGLPPMQSIQLLAMINGRITAHSEAVPGLLLARGIKIRERWTGEPMTDNWTCHIELERRDGEKHEFAFSVKDAKQARLWDQREQITKKGKNNSTYNAANDSPWFKYPKRMLHARALGFAAKDFAADALRGIQLGEEAADMQREPPRDITPRAALPEPELPPEPEMPPDDEPQPFHGDPRAFVDNYRNDMVLMPPEERQDYCDANATSIEMLPKDMQDEIDEINRELMP